MVQDSIDPSDLNDLILRSIVDHAIVTLDAAGRVTSWNEGAERILGWTEAGIVGRSADAFFTPEDVTRDRLETEMRVSRAEGRCSDERWHIRKDGRRFWASGLMMPLLSADGGTADDHAAGFVKIFRDRTYEHETDRRIALLESRAALAMRRSGRVGVFELDLQAEVIIADATCIEMHDLAGDPAPREIPVEAFYGNIHPEDAPAFRAALERTVRDGADLDAAYRVRLAAPRHRWVQLQATLHRDDEARPARLSGIVVDATEQQHFAAMQQARLGFIDALRDRADPGDVAGLAATVIGTTLQAGRAVDVAVSGAGRALEIRAAWRADGAGMADAGGGASGLAAFLPALEAGTALVIEDAQQDGRRAEAEAAAALGLRSLIALPQVREGRLRSFFAVGEAGARSWSQAEIDFVGAIVDRTQTAIDRARAEAARDLLVAEMAHRMKNMLTIAQVIVSQTLGRSNDMATARKAVAARMKALGEAQDVLTKVEHDQADIRDVVRGALKPHWGGAGRMTAEGPAVELGSQQGLGLSLALHELATNALKHGALSNEAGQVAISWTLKDGGLKFRWVETGGPPVCPPAAKGFGSNLLERVVGSYFGGTSTVAYDPAGVAFTLEGSVLRPS